MVSTTDLSAEIQESLDNKVDKIDGKDLSANDYTDADKEKLAGIAEGANNYSHPETHPANMITGLPAVAVSGSYDDLTNKPTKVSEFENDAKYLTSYTETDPTVPDWAKQTTKPTYTADEVKAVSYEAQVLTEEQKAQVRSNIGAGASAFSGDYQDLINKPTIPSTLADLSDDTTHRTVSDTEKTHWNAKSNFSGSYDDLTNKPTIPSIDDNSTSKSGTWSSEKITQVISDNAPTVPEWAQSENKPTYTADEVGASPSQHDHAISEITDFPSTMTPSEHSHSISDVNELQNELNAKASQQSVDNHVSDTTKHITSDERAKWNAAQTKADSAYALAEGKVDSLSDLGVTATATELNYVDGVTENIQTQLDTKAPAYSYGTEDLTPGVSSLATGTLYFVYE
jgi:hypothetical protein